MTGHSYNGVLVGTDGSASAQCAVHAAGAIARALGVPVTVATAWYRDKMDELTAMEVAGSGESAHARNAHWATDTVVDAGGSLRAMGLDDVRTSTPEGAPAEALLRLSEERPGTLVVVGTIGLDSTAERLIGNIPHQLTHHALADLLLVSRHDCGPDISWTSVALATDGSATASLACEHGAGLARSLGAKSTLLTVAGAEERGQKAFEATAVATDDTHVAIGRDITQTLVEAARGYDLLVLGNKGMSGPSRLLGSVANSVTHQLPTDLLLVNTTR